MAHGRVHAVAFACLVALACVGPSSFVVPGRPSLAPPSALRGSISGRISADSDILEPVVSTWSSTAALAVMVAAGFAVGVLAAPQEASASGMGLQGLPPMRPVVGAISFKERNNLTYANLEKTVEEMNIDIKAIKKGLAEDPKEKRVAEAMEQMREMNKNFHLGQEGI